MSGTTVTAGTGLFRTTAVGGDAYAHRLAREARRYSLVVSELQAGTNRVLHWISWVIVPVALVLVWSQLRLSGSIAETWSSGAWRHAVVAGIAGVVSMVPQGLVLLTSVNFATASLSLARRNVLVQELPAVEVLARVDTLCLDKTGTITTGRIRLGEVQGPDGDQAPSEVLSALALLSTVGEANATADAIREGLSNLRGLGEQGLKDARGTRKYGLLGRRGVGALLLSPQVVRGSRPVRHHLGARAPQRSSWQDTASQCWTVLVRSLRRECVSWPWPDRDRPGGRLRGG